MELLFLREGFKKKTIESVIMIIAGGEGGPAGGDHILLIFFNAPNLVVWLY